MCGATRLLVPAFVVGLAVATLVGNDVYGWIAAGITIAVLAVVQKLRGTSASCTIPPRVAADTGVEMEPRDGEPADPASR